jgi:hypothetical protein
MNKFFKIILSIALLPSFAFADCDWSLGIKPLADGNFEYTKSCHLQVGLMNQQISDLKKAIDLDNDAIKASDSRTQMWMTTAFQMEDRVDKVDSLQKSNNWLYFSLGGITVILVAIPIALLTHRN